MRRTDKEILDQALLEKILIEELVCRIALNDNGKPYLVPMIFGYQDHCLFLHSATAGRKIDILKKNNEICKESLEKTAVIKCKINQMTGKKSKL